MEEKKKFIDPITWAKHSLILSPLGIVATIFSPELGLAFLMTAFIGGLISLIGLLFTKNKTIIPYLCALASMIICVATIKYLQIAHLGGIDNARTIICKTNMKQISNEILKKMEDTESSFNIEEWCDMIKDEIDNESVFKCRNDKVGPCSYAMNKNIPVDAKELPPDLVLLFESFPGWNRIGGPVDVVLDRHKSFDRHKKPGTNIAFADGRVEFIYEEDIPNLRWTVKNKDD